MESNKVLSHAMRALVALYVLSVLVTGCDKKKDEVYPAEGHAYMRDPVFVEALRAQDDARNSIYAEREKIIGAFAALEAREGSRAAAEKLAEWKELEARAKKCGEAYEANRRRTTELLRERMARASEDSERIKRGEAVEKRREQRRQK